MMYTDDEIKAVISTAPDESFGDHSEQDKITWVKFVMSVDSNPKAHKLVHYSYLARAMAEGFGSVHPQDYGDDSALEQIKSLIVATHTPYKDMANEEAAWRSWKITPVQASLATRVVKEAIKKAQLQSAE
jgi:hypothetical protein